MYQNMMKIRNAGSFALLGIVLIAILAVSISRVHAIQSSVFTETTAVATSTATYMTAGTATTTYQVDSGNTFASGKPGPGVLQTIDAQQIFLEWISAQATSTLAYQIQVSNNNVDWYGMNSLTSTTPGNSSGNWNVASSTVNTYYWTPGIGGNATTTNFTSIVLPPVIAPHERIVFSVPVGSPAGAIYAEINLKQLPSGGN